MAFSLHTFLSQGIEVTKHFVTVDFYYVPGKSREKGSQKGIAWFWSSFAHRHL